MGLELPAVKDTKEAMVEVGPSIDRGGATIPLSGLPLHHYHWKDQLHRGFFGVLHH